MNLVLFVSAMAFNKDGMLLWIDHNFATFWIFIFTILNFGLLIVVLYILSIFLKRRSRRTTTKETKGPEEPQGEPETEKEKYAF